MPKKSGLIDERQAAICARVKMIREESQLSQPAFAGEVGITLDQLASVEYARIPLRFALGDWLCRRFDVCQRWLVEGKEPRFYYVSVDPRIYQPVAPTSLFSEAYDSTFKPYVDEHLKQVAKRLGCAVDKIRSEEAHANIVGGVDYMSAEAFNFITGRLMKFETEFLPQFLFQKYYTAIANSSRAFRQKHKKEIEQFQAQKKKHQDLK